MFISEVLDVVKNASLIDITGGHVEKIKSPHEALGVLTAPIAFLDQDIRMLNVTVSVLAEDINNNCSYTEFDSAENVKHKAQTLLLDAAKAAAAATKVVEYLDKNTDHD